jgi:hypothetical protein
MYESRWKHEMDILVVLDGIVVRVLANGSKVSGLKPGRRRQIFQGNKNP